MSQPLAATPPACARETDTAKTTIAAAHLHRADQATTDQIRRFHLRHAQQYLLVVGDKIDQ